jgi:hypothetical protein
MGVSFFSEGATMDQSKQELKDKIATTEDELAQLIKKCKNTHGAMDYEYACYQLADFILKNEVRITFERLPIFWQE